MLAAGFPELGIGFPGVALAFGLTVLTMVYAVGGISGGHFNPAVTLGLAAARTVRLEGFAGLLGRPARGRRPRRARPLLHRQRPAGMDARRLRLERLRRRLARRLRPGAAFVCETVLTAGFLVVILGATRPGAPAGFAPIAIGLALTLIHLVSIPVTNTSVNPARSTAVAFFAETGAVGQLWLFWVAPLLGALIGAAIWKGLLDDAV